jgi:small-conductance mechanosensitive channel
MHSLWQEIYFGNSLQDWAIALAIILGGFILLRLLKKTVLTSLKKWASKTTMTFDDLVVLGVERAVFPLLYLAFVYLGLKFLEFPAKWEHIKSVALWVVVMFFLLKIVTSVVKYFILRALDQDEAGRVRQKQAGGLILILNFCIYIIGFIFLLDNLGYNMGTLIAGLGIGGIAIALAAQAILSDLFSYFVIFFDKPFEVGDFISVEDQSGTIEHIGFKTTRVKSPNGEQIVFSNKDLTDSRIHNFQRMEKRMVIFQIGVVYNTPVKTLEEIPDMVKNVILKQERVSFDRGHFTGFKNSSMNFEFVYHVLTTDYSFYMATHQAIWLNILQSFGDEKIELAYPSQTVYLESKEDNKSKTTMG